MTPRENLHYALGQLAYCVACVDGAIQNEERKKFQNIVETELRCGNHDFDISDIIFRMMEKDGANPETAYEWAIKEIKLNSQYLSPELKKTFVRVIKKVAKAFLPVTAEEQKLIEKFQRDIESIHGDPVFYEKTALD